MNVKGEEVGKIELKEVLFGQKPSREFLHEYVTVYRANQRQGTAHTKTRGEVSGGGKKPWKQKHTGRARAGSNRSPLWRHGGTTFGPRSSKTALDFPRQKAKLALAHALASQHSQGRMIFIEAISLEEPKTKIVARLLKTLGCQGRTLVVLDAPNPKLALAARNIPGVSIQMAADLNAYTVLNCRKLVMTQQALEKLGARWN
ncbi:MAG: 50S ribosomal protein L4 [Elusimicrobia bacterium]|nr:50S ribosomal protein L4 [Elusimicrobiota bacterium]